jgi:predicted nucleic acid-binding Zn ribbon protein
MTWREEWESPEARPDPPQPPPLGDLVRSMATTKGWGARLRGARIHSAWNDIAGEELARHVQPVRLAGGVLVLRAESPAWATQVNYLAPQLRDRANEVLGPDEVRSVTVQSGTTGQVRR